MRSTKYVEINNILSIVRLPSAHVRLLHILLSFEIVFVNEGRNFLTGPIPTELGQIKTLQDVNIGKFFSFSYFPPSLSVFPFR